MNNHAAYWVSKLQLNKHAEGGYYREIYRSPITVNKNSLPDGFQGDRNFSTSIYFLLEGTEFSAFHRIASDELWHFYSGNSLTIYEIENNGNVLEHYLGNDPDNKESFQVMIKAGNWFASKLTNGNGYALAGCTVSPGFDFADFELAARKSLINKFPQHEKLITELTRS
ncbi:MAG TPA: cupin domain-containing protein [Puia sp.]|nr:cupin domain-containing protein [Puia sp.]